MSLTKNEKIIGAASIVVIAAVAGLTTLYQYKNNPKKPAQKPQITTVDTTNKEDTAKIVNVCDYSMVEAFKKGLINSVNDYVNHATYNVDTIRLNINECNNVSKGYYTQISTGDSVIEKHITVNYILPDTANLPEPLKRMYLKFAEQTNDSIQQRSVVAHELYHASHDFSNYNLKIKERADIANIEEIMARFIEFSVLRECYKIIGDSTIFKSNFRFYQYALRRGDINPRSNDSIDQRSEQIYVLRNLFEQSNQIYVDIYDDEISKAIKKGKEYDPNQPNQYQQALEELFTIIWDGKLVNVDPINTKELEMPNLPENIQTLVNCLTAKEEYRISQSDTNKTNIDTTNLFIEKQNTMDNR